MNGFDRNRRVIYGFQRHRRGIKSWLTFLAGLIVTFGSGVQAFAADNNALQGFYSVTGGQALTQTGIISQISSTVADVFAIITAAAAGFGMVFIVWGGISLIHGGGMKKQEGMERIKNAIIGLVIALTAGFITGLAAFFAGHF